MTALTQAVHHGMIYVPLGYSAGPKMFSLDEPQGGSPWGAGTFAGARPAAQLPVLGQSLHTEHGARTAWTAAGADGNAHTA